MIEVRGLSKSYGSTPVLRSLSFCVQPGRITGLLGPNACGKTTLIKSMLGLVVPDSGDISFNGESVRGQCKYRQHIGYMPQNPDFPANLSPRELFSLLHSLRDTPPIRRDELIERFGLGAFLTKPFGTLSAGTRQKVSAVAAMMFQPPILILDEPTAGLDPVASVLFKDLLRELSGEDVTILIVSHIILELERLVDDILFLLDGELLFGGTVDELHKRSHSTDLEASLLELLRHGAGNTSQEVTDAR